MRLRAIFGPPLCQRSLIPGHSRALQTLTEQVTASRYHFHSAGAHIAPSYGAGSWCLVASAAWPRRLLGSYHAGRRPKLPLGLALYRCYRCHTVEPGRLVYRVTCRQSISATRRDCRCFLRLHGLRLRWPWRRPGLADPKRLSLRGVRHALGKDGMGWELG